MYNVDLSYLKGLLSDLIRPTYTCVPSSVENRLYRPYNPFNSRTLKTQQRRRALQMRYAANKLKS